MWFIFLSWISVGTHPHEAILNDSVIAFEPSVKGCFSAIEFICLILIFFFFCFVPVYKLRSLLVQKQLSSKPGGIKQMLKWKLELCKAAFFFFFNELCQAWARVSYNLKSQSRVVTKPRPRQHGTLTNGVWRVWKELSVTANSFSGASHPVPCCAVRWDGEVGGLAKVEVNLW